MGFYEINVSRSGRHFFATSERSLTSEREAREALSLFLAKFPESEGYAVTVTSWETRGEEVTEKLGTFFEVRVSGKPVYRGLSEEEARAEYKEASEAGPLGRNLTLLRNGVVITGEEIGA